MITDRAVHTHSRAGPTAQRRAFGLGRAPNPEVGELPRRHLGVRNERGGVCWGVENGGWSDVVLPPFQPVLLFCFIYSLLYRNSV